MGIITQKKALHVVRFFSSLLLFVFTLVLLGCSSGNNKTAEADDSSPKGKLDACALLTADEAAKALGDSVTKSDAFPRNMELQGGKILNSSCQYDAVSSDRVVGLNITFAPMNRNRYPKTLDEYIKMSEGDAGPPDEGKVVKPVAIPGVGDFAVWQIKYGIGSLLVYSKGYKAIITMGSSSKGGSESDLEPAKTLAKGILGKL